MNNIGVPKPIYSDQGPEFKNNTFKKYQIKIIQIIFSSKHAQFVRTNNKTMKNRMMKYMN